MKRNELIQLLASQSATPPAKAADELDRVVNDILKRLRNGNAVQLPGIGLLRPDANSGIHFRPVVTTSPEVSRKKEVR